MSWNYDLNSPKWRSAQVSQKILGSCQDEIPINLVRQCAFRLRKMRDELRKRWVGFDLGAQGYLTDWILSALIARENILLIGSPGVAKSEIAVSTFELLDLSLPIVNRDAIQQSLKTFAQTGFSVMEWWKNREEEEQKNQKYFHYLLSRFTQPDEIFGPVEISLLKQGILTHVNFGLLTGPGVRAAFLDEVFKASSSILNTLLTIMNERKYFNFGGMVNSDLISFICAANEMPGGFATGTVSGGSEDFNLLYAFLDRFPIRLHVPTPSGTSCPEGQNSDLVKASHKAIEREARRFAEGKAFENRPMEMPCINDILLLGRCCFHHEVGKTPCLFNKELLQRFRQAFYRIGVNLQQNGTKPESSKITWTISPRKLKALYKIALAHALVRDDGFNNQAELIATLNNPEQDLHVFDLIWDTLGTQNALESNVKNNIKAALEKK